MTRSLAGVYGDKVNHERVLGSGNTTDPIDHTIGVRLDPAM